MKFSGVFKGRITNHRTGEITYWEKHNLVVKGGFDWIADLMSNTTTRSPAISHIAFGTGAEPTTYNMTRLVNEVYRSQVTATWNDSTRTLVFTGSIPEMSGLNVSIAEVGLFNASSAGIMFDRANFTPKGIDNDMSFDYSFNITITE